MKNIEDKIPDITNLATTTNLNLKINQIKNKITKITNLAIASDLAAADNKTSNVSNLVKENLTIIE